MTPTFRDTDGDGRKEPLYGPDEIDEAAKVAEDLGLEGGVHAQDVDGETKFAPGDSPRELDRVQQQLAERSKGRAKTEDLFDEEGNVKI